MILTYIVQILMWREEEDRYVRFPVPEAFDKLVQRLQNEDTVLWESISLPSLKSSNAETPSPTEESHPQTSDHPEDYKFLISRIRELEAMNMEKDTAISNLRRELKELKDGEKRAKSSHDARMSNEAAFYKQKFEQMKNQYDKLREVLAANGRLRRVKCRSVSVIKM